MSARNTPVRLALSLAALAAALAASPAMARDLVIRAAKLHTMAGAPIDNGVVVIRNGKISAVGPAGSVSIPAGVEVVDAAVVTPGLVDARSTVGLSGYMNQPHDQDQLDASSPVQPQLRAIDAYNPNERLVEWVRSLGVTTLHTGHGTGALVSGQTMVVKTRGNTVEAAMIRPEAMIAAELGPGAMAERGKSPGTRAKQMAMLRALLLKARGGKTSADNGGDGAPTKSGKREAWREEAGPALTTRNDSGSAKAGDKPTGRDLEAEAVRDILARRIPLLVSAWKAQDIMSAIRLKQEFGINLVLDGAAEAYLVLDQLKAANVPVILHPTMARQSDELENASWTTAAKLRAAGIPFALQSGFEDYVPKTRVVLWEAAIAAANGLSQEDALRTITIDAAKIIGVGDRVGSLEVGKDGDIAMFDGDPFEYTTHVTGVVIDGDIVSRTPR